ncbi:MAG: AraC family transcriptional regulator [Terriglobales bacterium]
MSINTGKSAEVTKSWRSDAANGLELLYAKYIDYSFARHTHEGFAVGVIEQGANRFDYRGSAHVASAGALMLINPAEVHTGSASDKRGWTFRMFYVDALWLQALATSYVGKRQDLPFFGVPVVHDRWAATRLLRAHRALENPGVRLEQESLLVSAFSRLLERYADRRLVKQSTEKCKSQAIVLREYLEDNYSENISLDELSRLVQLSGSHLIRIFRAFTGIPPHAYLEQIRVNRAKERLRLGGSSLADVACESGFFDQSHFTRQFKKRVGVTPGEYLKGQSGPWEGQNVQDIRVHYRAL